MRRALVVIDVQNDYFDGNLPVAHPDPAVSVANIGQAMDAARASGVAVVVVETVLPEGLGSHLGGRYPRFRGKPAARGLRLRAGGGGRDGRGAEHRPSQPVDSRGHPPGVAGPRWRLSFSGLHEPSLSALTPHRALAERRRDQRGKSLTCTHLGRHAPRLPLGRGHTGGLGAGRPTGVPCRRLAPLLGHPYWRRIQRQRSSSRPYSAFASKPELDTV
jgi:hypothetical protein